MGHHRAITKQYRMMAIPIRKFSRIGRRFLYQHLIDVGQLWQYGDRKKPSQTGVTMKTSFCSPARRIVPARLTKPGAIFAAILALPAWSLAQTQTDWTGSDSSSWSDPGNWDAGVPADGETANLANGENTAINYDYAGPAVSLAYLTVDNTAGGAETLTLPGNSLTAGDSEIVGFIGTATINQTNGVNQIGFGLSLAEFSGSEGGYNLVDGTLTSAGYETVGQAGPGEFNQTGGTNTYHTNLIVAYDAGVAGTYSLSGGVLTAAGSAIIGNYGSGNINQSGGTYAFTANTSSLYLGYNAGSTGTYTLSGGGSLAGGFEYVGLSGTGIFNQTGGSNTMAGNSQLFVGYQAGAIGTYALSGGTLSIASGAFIGGYSSGAGGTGTLTISGSAALNVTGSVTIYSTSTMNVDGGSVTVGNLAVSTGGTVNVNQAMVIDYGGNVDPVGTILSYLTDGYNSRWAGGEISSSSVSNLNATQSALVYSVGYADGADGITSVPSGEIEIMPTLAGDAKLQGSVSFGDYQILAQYFGQSGGWDEGNFTYGATIDFGDFQLLAQDFGSTSSGLSGNELAAMNQLAWRYGDTLVANADGVGFSVVSVPEPVSWPLAIVAAAALVRRGRRKANRAS
jgi:hypothetical protein